MKRSRFGVFGCALLALGLLSACSNSNSGTNVSKDAASSDGGGNGDDNTGKASNGSGVKPDAGGGTTGGTSTGDASMTNNAPQIDFDGCIPQGCDDVGALCGEIDPGCGLPLLSCDPDGKACRFPEFCGGDPGKGQNQCGCKPKTCADVECGADVDDGCNGTLKSCGNCSDRTGANWQCNNTSNRCECVRTTCGARVCGAIPDGCGGANLTCGPNAGACDSPAKKCDSNGACVCKTDTEYKATACGSQTCGTVTIAGCPFNCGSTCTNPCAGAQDCRSCACGSGEICGNSPAANRCCAPLDDKNATAVAALCTSQNKSCGETVIDSCSGKTVTCGCPAGKGCVDKDFIVGASVNQCLDSSLANLLGGYVVRTHAFTRLTALGGVVDEVTRAEAISLVKIVQKNDAQKTLEMRDEGCVATSANEKASGRNRTVASAYFRIPPVLRPIKQSATDNTKWLRDFRVPGVGLGFVPENPGYCTGSATPSSTNAGNFDATPGDENPTNPYGTPSSGSSKAWLKSTSNPNGTCTCMTQGASANTSGYCAASVLDASGSGAAVETAKNCMPDANAGRESEVTDCRVNDLDNDGRPGFTVIAEGNTMTGISLFSNIKWEGAIRASGNHVWLATDPNPIYRSAVSCAGGACAGVNLATSTSCGTTYNLVQFSKVSSGFKALTCEKFYNISANGTFPSLARVAESSSWNSEKPISGAVAQTTIDSYFKGIEPCGTGNTCPEGMICRPNDPVAPGCWPKSTDGACAPLPGSSATLSCGANWICDQGNSCWPNTATCDPR